jgi:uncharacterized protein YcaQ
MRVLSKEEARALSLHSQGLGSRDAFGKGSAAVLQALEHLSYVQIDTISVVERAHHHVLWNRVSDYRAELLSALVAERKAFEYWSHAAAYLPMRDYRFTLPRKHLYATGKKHWFTATKEHKRERLRILAKLRNEGAVSIRDFPAPKKKKSSGWFERSPAKQALEQLFMEGRLMLSGRRGFEKMYDLTERVLPAEVDSSLPTQKEFSQYLIRSALRAHGLARPEEIAYLRGASIRDSVSNELRVLQKEGFVDELKVEGLEHSYFALNGWEKNLKKPDAVTRILSPFDNHLIQRRRMQELFSFDYMIECYVPEAKRKFGYFCLPVMAGDSFIGRIDTKADRAKKILELKAIHPEKIKKGELREKLSEALPDFAKFNSCQRIGS